MNSQKLELHFIQNELIKRLTLNQKLKFNELLLKGLESEHVNYHLKQLIKLGLAKKEGEYYTLSDSGKDYSNLMDDNHYSLEKQPKTSILLNIVQKNKNDEYEFLLTKRLKHPFFGKVMQLTGKVRFGESLENAGRRELMEETGLSAEIFTLEKISHIIRKKKNGEVVQDVLFYVFFVTGLSGDLIKNQPYQKNFWITKKQFETDKTIDTFKGLKLKKKSEPDSLCFKEYITEDEGY